MSTVNKFVLDEQTIEIEDATARANASSAMASVQTLTGTVNEIKELSRLSVTYDSAKSTMTFSTGAHK